MKTISYKNFIDYIEPDLDDGILIGPVINTRDIIGFNGNTISEAIESFHAVIEEYIEDCQKKVFPRTNPIPAALTFVSRHFLIMKLRQLQQKQGKRGRSAKQICMRMHLFVCLFDYYPTKLIYLIRYS